MDYIVRAYTNDDDSILEWTLRDRTESEARSEAEAEIATMDNIEDWTLTPVMTDGDIATLIDGDRVITVWENEQGEMESMITLKGGVK